MKERLLEFLVYLGIGQNKFEEKVGLSIGYINKLKGDMKLNTIDKITSTYSELDKEWLITGKGSMLKSDSGNVQFYTTEQVPINKRLIPLWDDVSSVGGKLKKGYSANMESNSKPAEWIDPGDWFKNATDAIRHYEDSMIEYPSGCILALKEVYDRQLIVPGKDYVIETSEYRITKKLQSSNSEYIRVRSTNEEKYEDGELIHGPFNIQQKLIHKIFEVLGYVVKKGGGTMVHTNNK